MAALTTQGFQIRKTPSRVTFPRVCLKRTKTAFAQTNFSFHGDPDGNHSAWGLNMNSTAIQQLQANGGSNAQWLNAIANSDTGAPFSFRWSQHPTQQGDAGALGNSGEPLEASALVNLQIF